MIHAENAFMKQTQQALALFEYIYIYMIFKYDVHDSFSLFDSEIPTDSFGDDYL